MAEDFDDPLPDDLLDLFEGKRKERGTEEPGGCSWILLFLSGF
jgi:hypothetical protein